jgi:hypothetical protein
MVLLLSALGLILVASIAFVLGGSKNLPALVPYIAFGLASGGAGAALLVAALRLPLPPAR